MSTFGSASDYGIQYTLNQWGLTPGKDVVVLQVGSQPERFAALESGSIEATVISPPFNLVLRQKGYHELADFSAMNIPFVGNSVIASTSFIHSHGDIVQAFLKAFVEGTTFYKTHKQESLNDMAGFLRTKDPAVLEETYRYYAVRLMPRVPYPGIKGIAAVLKFMGQTDAKASKADPRNFVDATFMEGLDKSGFIEGLYKSNR